MSDSTDWLDVEVGDVMVINADFRFQITNGSGSDDVMFRIYMDGDSVCPDLGGNSTGALENFDEHRGEYIPVHIQQTETATCSGRYRFSVETNLTNTDDVVEMNNISITAVRY